ncbi:hypothetical protein Rhsp01_61260 [Rhizobium sp. NBRC 114257]|uniref:Uncharacterized protein n=1 Tax=Rhizobium dioscoreae TaxID=2653122 RepID=A0ABQ0ZD25_9HYPH|nr:hypothetical protein RsS93_61000 [Rhizobium dioscoreae]GLU84950.1 hypothetical protein Rhsp01_61260 [Rhizobium sp. NBRC 114257]
MYFQNIRETKVLLLSNILIYIIERKYLDSHKSKLLIYTAKIERKFTKNTGYSRRSRGRIE